MQALTIQHAKVIELTINDSIQVAQQHQDLQETTRVLGQMCLQLDCETACQAPIIRRICQDDAAAVFMRQFARGSLRPLQVPLDFSMFQHLDLLAFRR